MAPADLPESIGRMTRTFDLVESLRARTRGEDREEIDDRLKRLDLEITDHLIDEYFEEEPVENPLSTEEYFLKELWDAGLREGLSPAYLKKGGIDTRGRAELRFGGHSLRRTGTFKIKYKLERHG